MSKVVEQASLVRTIWECDNCQAKVSVSEEFPLQTAESERLKYNPPKGWSSGAVRMDLKVVGSEWLSWTACSELCAKDFIYEFISKQYLVIDASS